MHQSRDLIAKRTGFPKYVGFQILDELGYCRLHHSMMQATRIFWIMHGWHKRCIECGMALTTQRS